MIKKYILLLFSLIIIQEKGNSQEKIHIETIPIEIKKWTLKSIVFAQPYTFERNNSLPNFFTGVGAKMNFNKISYRVSFEHVNYINEIDNRFQKGYITESTGRIGAEYKINRNDLINLNFFLDAGVAKVYEEANISNLDSNINIFETYDGYAVGAIVGIGFDYFITQSLSIALETRIDFMHIYGDYHKEDYTNKYSVNYFTSNNKFNLNLLGNFSVNYHF